MSLENYIWDYSDPAQYLNRIEKSSMPPLMISVAITGGVHGRESNPNLPETPEQQAESCYEAYKAGACLVHIHARDPQMGYAFASTNTEDYRLINKLVREKCPDIIINNTTGAGLEVDREKAMCCLKAGPEAASLNCGPLLVKARQKKREPPLSGRDETLDLDGVIPVNFTETEVLAKAMMENGIKAELEVYHNGQFQIVRNLISKGLIKPPYYVQFVMGFSGGASPTADNLVNLVHNLPPDSLFQVIGIGVHQIPITTIGIIMGGHVRVGLEDNIYRKRGELLSNNAENVEKVARLAGELGRAVATPAQAREMLGVSSIPSTY